MEGVKGKKKIIYIAIALVFIVVSIAIITTQRLGKDEETTEVSKLQATELPNYKDDIEIQDLGKVRVGETKSFILTFNYLQYHHTTGWDIGMESNGENYAILTNNGFDGESAHYNIDVSGTNPGTIVIAVWKDHTKIARYQVQIVEKASISFSKTTMTLSKGNYDTFTVTYKGSIVNSVVNDSSIAHISYRDYGSGFTVTVTADKAGSTPIVFTASDGVESVNAILNLTVTDSGGATGPSVTFNTHALTVAKGSSTTFTVTYAGTIVSSFVDTNIATISYNANTNPMTVTVTGKAAGTTQISITAIAVNTSASDVLTLTVTDSGGSGGGGEGGGQTTPAPEIKYTGSTSMAGLVGTTKTLSPAITWSNCKPSSITGTNNDVAEVQFEWGNGTSAVPTATKVKLKKAGTTTLRISAKNSDESATDTLDLSIKVYNPLTCTITSNNGIANEGWTNIAKPKFVITFNQEIKHDSFTLDDIESTIDKSKLSLTRKDDTYKTWVLEITNPTTVTPVEFYVKKDSCILKEEENIKNEKSNVFKYTPDLTKPKVSAISVTSDKTTAHYNKTATITIDFTITDNGQIPGTSHLNKDNNLKVYLKDGNNRQDITSSVTLNLTQMEYDNTNYKYIKFRATIKNITQNQGMLDFEIVDSQDTTIKDKAGNIFEKYVYSADTQNYRDIAIDNVKPKVSEISVTSNKDTAHYNKDATITIDFTIRDNGQISGTSHLNKDNNLKVYLKDGNNRQDITSSVTLNLTQMEYDNTNYKYIKFRATIKNITQDQGILDFEIVDSQDTTIKDQAGNVFEKYTYSADTQNYRDIAIDNVKPKVSEIRVTSDKSTAHYNKDATITIDFTITDNGQLDGSKHLNKDNNLKVYLKDGNNRKDITSSVTGFTQTGFDSTNYKFIKYKATISGIEENQGILDFEIVNSQDTNVKDQAGNVFEEYVYSADTQNYRDIVIDNVPPTIKNLQYDKSGEWKTKQEIIVEAEDNCTPKDEISIDYVWENTTKEEENLRGTVLNQQKIAKATNYGVYKVALKYIDLAGNYDIRVLENIKLDTELSDKEMGAISVKNKNNGSNYVFPQEKTDNAFKGGYTKDNLEISIVEGLDGEGKESGHKITTYKIYKDGDSESLVGDQTTANTTLYDNGIYTVVVTSKDMVENSRSEQYVIYKGIPNVTFDPNGAIGISASTKVTLSDDKHNYPEISYVWLKEGEKIEDNTKWTKISDGDTVAFSPKAKITAFLYVKTVDEDGNVNITKSNKFIINGKIDNPGTLIYKEDDENGKELKLVERKALSNKDVWMNIKAGNDTLGPVKTTYKVTKDDQIVVGEGTRLSSTLTKEGLYNVEITSIRTNDNLVEKEENTILVDKTKPQITFTSASEPNAKVEKLKVDVLDNEGIQNARSGVSDDSLKYCWVQGFEEPENFDEKTNKYSGKFTNGSVLTAPKRSGVWTLWIYAEDKVGNPVKDRSVIKNSDDADSEVTKPGTLEITKPDGTEYKPALEGQNNEPEYTNLNLKIKLLPGYDEDNEIVSNTYKIKKDGTTLTIDGKDELDKEITLKENGTYVVTVKTIDGAGNTATNVYTIKIDKNGPVIKFEPDGNKEVLKQHEVSVKITDDKTSSEIGKINKSSVKCVWVGFNKENETVQTIKTKLAKFVKQKSIAIGDFVSKITEEQNVKELGNKGIDVVVTKASSKVKTPKGKTGKYMLYVYAEDTLGNASLKASKEYNIDKNKTTEEQTEKDTTKDTDKTTSNRDTNKETTKKDNTNKNASESKGNDSATQNNDSQIDNTQKGGILPYTGVVQWIIAAVMLVGIVGFVSYKKYKKLKNV